MFSAVIFFVIFSASIEQIETIQCYTCRESGNFCPLPLNLDGGDESNENDIDAFGYDPGYFCQSEHYIDKYTGVEKLILRGIRHCHEVDVPNRRVYCCRTDNCNKYWPPMRIEIPSDYIDGKSSNFYENNFNRVFPSIYLIGFVVLTIILFG